MPNSVTRSKNNFVVSIWKTVGPKKWLAKATIIALLGSKVMKNNPTLKSHMVSCLRNFSNHEQMIKVIECMLLHLKDVSELLPAITAPILFIVGEDDSLNPPKEHRAHVNKYVANPSSDVNRKFGSSLTTRPSQRIRR